MTIDNVQLADLRAILGPDGLDELLAIYREDLAHRLALLRGATDPDEIRDHAHALRSGAATFGATILADAARALEHDRGSLAAIECAASETDTALLRYRSKPVSAT